jgi:hypothetical protein
MIEELIASGVIGNCEYRSVVLHGDVLHKFKVIGTFGFEQRLEFYKKTLGLSRSSNYFCILDNRNRHENTLTHEEMDYFTRMILNAGVTHFYGVTVTTDRSYAKLVTLANAVSNANGLQAELFTTSSYPEAEKLIIDKMKSAAA